jgi:hypothetical protein
MTLALARRALRWLNSKTRNLDEIISVGHHAAGN